MCLLYTDNGDINDLVHSIYSPANLLYDKYLCQCVTESHFVNFTPRRRSPADPNVLESGLRRGQIKNIPG